MTYPFVRRREEKIIYLVHGLIITWNTKLFISQHAMANMSRVPVCVRSLDHVDIMTEDCSVLSNEIDDQSMYP